MGSCPDTDIDPESLDRSTIFLFSCLCYVQRTVWRICTLMLGSIAIRCTFFKMLPNNSNAQKIMLKIQTRQN